MLLRSLVSDMPEVELLGAGDVEIARSSRTTRGSSRPGMLFCCLRGAQHRRPRPRRRGRRGRRRRPARRAPPRPRPCPSCSSPTPVLRWRGWRLRCLRPPVALARLSSASPAPTARPPPPTCSATSSRRPAAAAEVLGTLTGARTTPEAPELQRTLAGWRDRRRRGRGHGGVVARARPAPGRRHPLPRRRVHQPEPRPPRLPRHDGGVLRGQGPPVRARPAPTRGVVNLDSPYGRLLADAAADPDRRLLAWTRSTTSQLERRRDRPFTWRGHGSRCPSAARSTSPTRWPRPTPPPPSGVDDATIAAGLCAAARGARPLRAGRRRPAVPRGGRLRPHPRRARAAPRWPRMTW